MEGSCGTYNGILLSYKKEHIWVSSNEVDEPRAYYTKWSKLERENQIWYINIYTWNLEGFPGGSVVNNPPAMQEM